MSKMKFITTVFLRMVLLLAVVCAISFTLISKAPFDPLVSYIGVNSTLSDEAKEEISNHWGLNEPLPERFATWAKNAVMGDLGNSITYKKSVIDVIKERVSYSIVLMMVAWTFSGVLGFVLGIIAGMKNGSFIDKVIKFFCLLLQSSPTFWFGLLILSLFAVSLKWFPIGMAAPIGKLSSEITIWDKIYHLILPALTLTLVSISKITLYTRQKFIEIINSDYILFAKARGESEKQIIFRHVIRNAAIPAITLQFASFSELFGGMALAETVFSYPGIGTATTAAALSADVPLLLGIAAFSAVFVFTGNLAANILYGVLDPRVKEKGDYV